ncbi:MAG TPA: hypothetical protein VNN79_16190 [Actinomycetota bacterium]|nr:hypothetical protein [Actinomycetota bacterium]
MAGHEAPLGAQLANADEHPRRAGPERIAADRELRGWLYRALGEWGALRGGEIDPRRFARKLTAPAFVQALGEARDLRISRFDPNRHGEVLVRLFEGLDGIKSSEAQLVATSKALYHLLPELVVPFDGVITCGFFGWNTLPQRIHAEWLIGVYTLLAGVASKVGSRELDRLGTPSWPLDPAVAGALRLGQARVIDFGLEGYRRSAGRPWYVA